jgi:hypothetical protein
MSSALLPACDCDSAETALGKSCSSFWNEAVVKKKINKRNTTSIMGVMVESNPERSF